LSYENEKRQLQIGQTSASLITQIHSHTQHL
jgi:hypothetical protein